MTNKEFEDISISKWKIAAKSAAGRIYRVFKSAAEFETVEAENASEAVAKSGVDKVYMVKYGIADDMYMLNSSQIARVDETIAAM